MVHLRRMTDASVGFNSVHLTQLHFQKVQPNVSDQEEPPTEEYNLSHASCIPVPLQH